MADEREDVPLRGLTRWLILALLVLSGLVLYFAVGRTTPPVVPASVLESGQ
jgi:hypothetical protein